jgi:hypothetical protein
MSLSHRFAGLFSLFCLVAAVGCSAETDDVATDESLLNERSITVALGGSALFDVDVAKPCTGGSRYWDVRVTGASEAKAVLVTFDRTASDFGDAELRDASGSVLLSFSGGTWQRPRFAFRPSEGAVLRVRCVSADARRPEPLTRGKVAITARATELFLSRHELLAAGFVSRGTESASAWGAGWYCTAGNSGSCEGVWNDGRLSLVDSSGELFEHPDGRIAIVDEGGVVRGPIKPGVYVGSGGAVLVTGLRVTAKGIALDYGHHLFDTEPGQPWDVSQLWAVGSSPLASFAGVSTTTSPIPAPHAQVTPLEDLLIDRSTSGVSVGDAQLSTAHPVPRYVAFAGQSTRYVSWLFAAGTPANCDRSKLVMVSEYGTNDGGRYVARATVRTGSTLQAIAEQREGTTAKKIDWTSARIPLGVTMPNGDEYRCF